MARGKKGTHSVFSNTFCSLCKTNKTHDEMQYNANGHAAYCKECNRKRGKERYRFNRESIRSNQMHRDYDLTLEEYNDLLKLQNNVCAVCSGINKDGRALYIDHNHETGKVRGLLCHNCNLVLGLVSEKINILERLRDYLIKHSSVESIIKNSE